ncbi:MAG: N-acetylglucosaminyltransferase, partial [Microcoleus sp. Co-bin12]|nr:N-acetylglucosaminyltransferase [Microcoleus sp. Co-bin12]
MIQSYKNPKQITRLVETLHRASSNALILVSHSIGSCQLEEVLLQLPNVYVLYVQGSRGDFVTVQNYLNAIDWLLSNGFEFDWLINLSAQDYPIRSLKQIERALQKTQYDGFLECFKVFSEESPWGIAEGKTRYYYRYRKIDRNLPEWQKT